MKIVKIIKSILLIKKYKTQLKTEFDLRTNWLNELYTVVSVPENKRKQAIEFGVEGYPYLNNEVDHFIKKLDYFLMRTGLLDVIGLKKMDKIDDLNVFILLTYKDFNIKNVFIKTVIFTLVLVIFTLLLIF